MQLGGINETGGISDYIVIGTARKLASPYLAGTAR